MKFTQTYKEYSQSRKKQQNKGISSLIFPKNNNNQVQSWKVFFKINFFYTQAWDQTLWTIGRLSPPESCCKWISLLLFLNHSKDCYYPPTTNYFLVVMLDEGIHGTTVSGKIKHKTNITDYSWKSFQLRSSSTVMRSGNNTSSAVRHPRGIILKKTGSKCNWVVNKLSD